MQAQCWRYLPSNAMPSLKFLNLDSQVHKVWLFYIGPSPNSMSFTSGFIFFFILSYKLTLQIFQLERNQWTIIHPIWIKFKIFIHSLNLMITDLFGTDLHLLYKLKLYLLPLPMHPDHPLLQVPTLHMHAYHQSQT